ncbi:sugar ABC transporter permease [Phycicoccus endophyticus]|uniref:Sugar ABC transporter permease n=1 Tax=Phycicoccus endophyticus TaxID=1690220 RepID=A0A7G9QZX6_9MICO|nr:sugar ABC transporter permease [Phycicoccus endophyticus]NHI20755.1 sugar ABC transporter permease [Phycicoccus endophyticus]QNN48901.1 sugar ABC transporter permease [Phycicoccus endophyticus]GGL43668.1 sugar ABC transporter permease [Phycicoccus endophyticus]
MAVRSGRSAIERGDRRFALLAATPAALTIAALFVYPLGYAVVLSLYELNDKRPAATRVVGLANYLQLLGDEKFLASLARTGVFCLFTVFGGVALAVGLGVLLNQPFRGRLAARVLLLVPWAVPPVVNGIMWKLVFDGSYGVANSVLMTLGIVDHRVQWLAVPDLTMGVLVFAELWKLTPFLTLMVIASLQSIPASMYRAASIDGAGSWQRFWRMTVPNLRGTIMFLLIVQSMWSIKVFDSIYVLTGGSGGPAGATTTVNFLAYLTTFSYLDRGYGAAMSIAIMVLVAVVTAFWVLVLGRRGKEASR